MSHRSEQIAEVIQRRMNDFFMREMEFPLDVLVTLTKVEVTPDLKNAYLYLSILPISKSGSILKTVKKHLGEARHYLGGKLVLWRCPKLEVLVDDSALKSRKVEKVLEELGK